MKLIENERAKELISENYNYLFNKIDGRFLRWGKTMKDDPSFSPFGPEILDLEITKGRCSGGCEFCYKRNGIDNSISNLSMSDFKEIIKKIPRTLTQIAFGITDVYANPNFFKMMEYTRKKGIIPNYTTHGFDVDDNAVKKTAELCGAVAVSANDKEKTYDVVKKFTDAGMKQVNIHFMLSEETSDIALRVIEDIGNDARLKKLNAIVFLGYKHKNPDSPFSSVSRVDTYKTIIDYCDSWKIKYGFDSCSCPLYFKSIEGEKNEKTLSVFAEPCESGLFSAYINCEGEFNYCSFVEGITKGLDVLNCKDFLEDIWLSEEVVDWRNQLINSTNHCDCTFKKICRKCLIYDIAPCKKGEINGE